MIDLASTPLPPSTQTKNLPNFKGTPATTEVDQRAFDERAGVAITDLDYLPMGDYLEGAAASNQGTAAGGENNYSLKSASCPQHPTPFLSWSGAINFTRICQHTLVKGAMFGSCSYWSQQKIYFPLGSFQINPKDILVSIQRP